MRIAIIHDWLTGMRGGEKCLEVFCELFPDADIFTLIYNKGAVSPVIEKMDIRTSFLQKIPGIKSNYRNYLPLFPAAIESFNLKGYDFILSSSHCAAKGVKIPAEALHICYCYTPMRYAWLFFEEYFDKYNPLKKIAAKAMINYLRKWDLKTNADVDFFAAISDNVRLRIKNFYGRQAEVIYPPVDTEQFSLSRKNNGYYLIVSALVPYKRVDIAIEAFNRLGKKLVVAGAGNCQDELKKTAKKNIEFIDWVGDKVLKSYYENSRALIFPGEEDFGIVPLEAQACGKPVIAFAKGGALETLTAETAVFFKNQSAPGLIEAINEFETKESAYDPQIIRNNSLRFDRKKFKEKIKSFIEEILYV